jgi:glycosyltransferase involved in cell wall biosynthesis
METVNLSYPLATIMIPARNEEKFIEQCLQSLIDQSYPPSCLEILILDGDSEDATAILVKNLAQKHSNIQLIHNAKRTIPAALNLGLASARGEIILRADAHTIYDRDYVRTCIELLMSTDAANVGGVIKTVGEGLISKAIALAVTSPFGVGNAYYRFANRQMWVDTVAFGCWRKKTLLLLGGWNEDYLINEDYELNFRLRRIGGKILLSPEVKSYYHSRSSITSLFRQYFNYGKWKIKTLVSHPESMVYRQAVPPLFVVSLLASICAIPLSTIPLLAVMGPYTLINLICSVCIAAKHGLKFGVLLPFIFFTIHFAWGGGCLSGLKTFGIPRFDRIIHRGIPRKAAAVVQTIQEADKW